MLPQVIGINGFAGSGKDTVAEYFINEHGYQKFAMADAVKDVLAILFGWDRKMLQGDTPESRIWREQLDPWWTEKLGKPFSPRIAMQQIGTDLFRNHFNQDIWCMIIENKILQCNNKVVITDLRFYNELLTAKQFGAEIIEVQRGEQPEWYQDAGYANQMYVGSIYYNKPLDVDPYQYMKEHYPEIHASEYSWIVINNPKYILKNNGTLDDLYNQIKGIYE